MWRAQAMLVWVLLVALGAAAAWWLLRRERGGYWERRGVLAVPAPSVLTVIRMLLSQPVSVTERMLQTYQNFPGQRFVGMSFPQNNLFIRDPELIKHVLIKDFDFFTDRGLPFDETVDPLSGHLFNLDGVRWKNLRIKLSPTFTSGKMKRMFPLIHECSKALESALEAPASTGEAVEVKDILSRYTTDVIGSCAFGVNCNSLQNPSSEFYEYGRNAFRGSTAQGSWLSIARLLFPNSTYLHKLANSTNKTFRNFFIKVLRENVEHREKSNALRHDFLDLLIEIKKKGRIVDDSVDLIEDPFLHVPVSTSSDDFVFTHNTLAAQAFVFFAAGQETSSTTMTFCLLELANHQDIQDTVRAEVQSTVRRHGALTYDAIADMTYLDQIVTESLRKYPPLPLLFRKVTKPYQLPGTDVHLDPGLSVTIPLAGLQHDPKYFPEPDRFDPDRFSKEAKAERPACTYLPFGEGPRICIGLRFGVLQTKLGLASVLARYQVRPSPLTGYPVAFDPDSFTAAVKNGCYLQFVRSDAAV